jgi:ureidoglycolate lyase
MTMNIKAVPLTQEAFAPFGQVLMAHGDGPERHVFAANMDNRRSGVAPNMAHMRIETVDLPVVIDTLERHSFSNQTFIPLNGTCQLVVVCPPLPDNMPDISKMTEFVAAASQAINYTTGVWHAPRTAISGPGEFVMFRWDDGSGADTELLKIDTPVQVV